MIEGRETVEESTVLNNSDDNINKGRTRDDTSPFSKSEQQALEDLFGQMLQTRMPLVYNKISELDAECKRKDEEIVRLTTENGDLREIMTDKDIEIKRLKKQLKQAENKLSLYEQGTPSVSVSNCDYTYDVTHFEEDADVNFFFTCLRQLTDTKISPDKYLLDCSAAIIPIFVVLKNDKDINIRFRYKGNLNDFCKEWNCNVVPYITDTEHANKLLLNPESFKSQVNRSTLSSNSPASWRRMSNGDKNVKELERATNVKYRLEEFFK